jgi:hypothetical protein
MLHDQDRPPVSIWDAFGVDQADRQQGLILSPFSVSRECASLEPKDLNDRSSRGVGEDNPLEPFDSEAGYWIRGGTIEKLPPNLAKYCPLEPQKLGGEAIISAERTYPPEDHIPIYHIASVSGRSEYDIKNLLSAYFPWTGVYELINDYEEQLRFVRYYSPTALDYLLEHHPKPPRVTSDLRTKVQIADELGCSPRWVSGKITEAKAMKDNASFDGLLRTGRGYRECRVYDQSVVDYLRGLIEGLPNPEHGDRTRLELDSEFGTGSTYVRGLITDLGIRRTLKHGRLSGQREGLYMCEADAERIRDTFYRISLAEVTEIETAWVRACTGSGSVTTRKCLTRLGIEEFDRRTTAAPAKPLRHITYSDAVRLIKGLLPIELPPHVMPESAIVYMMRERGSENTIRKLVMSRPYDCLTLDLPGTNGSRARCWLWGTVRYVDEQLPGQKSGIHYGVLPLSPEDNSPAKISSARRLQELYVDKGMLRKPPTFDEVRDKLDKYVGEKGQARQVYLAVGDRAEQWQRRQSSYPTAADPRSGPPSAPTSSQQATSCAPTRLTLADIAQRSGKDVREVTAVVEKLAGEYRTSTTVHMALDNDMCTAYSGEYLDAILMQLIGRTAEQIARMLRLSECDVAEFLAANCQANGRGRYDLEALKKVMAEFRYRPASHYVAVRVLAEGLHISEEIIIETISHHRGTVRWFCAKPDERVPYLSPYFNHMACTLFLKEKHGLKTPPLGWYHRYELHKIIGIKVTLADVDRYLEAQTAHSRVFRPRDINEALGAGSLPHYPLSVLRGLQASCATSS